MNSSKAPLFEIRSSGIAGAGAFALQPIPAWTRLIEYTGERVSPEVADARYDEDEASGNTHTVLFTVDDKTVIDAGVGGNEARFFNHSCGPNCQSRIIRRRVYLETIRDIAPGEELTYDYEIPREGEDHETARRKWPCHCGAPNCRGTLLLPLPEPARPARRKTTRSVARKKKRAVVTHEVSTEAKGPRECGKPRGGTLSSAPIEVVTALCAQRSSLDSTPSLQLQIHRLCQRFLDRQSQPIDFDGRDPV